MKEKKIRSIIKSLSWRIIASLTTIILVFLFTGKPIVSLGIGGVEFGTKAMFYYAHERGWNKIKWGIKK